MKWEACISAICSDIAKFAKLAALGAWDWETGIGKLGPGDWDWETGTGRLGLGDWDWDWETGRLGLGDWDFIGLKNARNHAKNIPTPSPTKTASAHDPRMMCFGRCLRGGWIDWIFFDFLDFFEFLDFLGFLEQCEFCTVFGCQGARSFAFAGCRFKSVS